MFIRFFVIEGIYPASESMEPTLYKGEYYFLEKLTYLFSLPKRGDIVVFPSPVDPEKDMVKRVIALPGESIEIRQKKVFIDSRELIEPYTQFTRADEILVGDNLGPLTVPDNKVFVMGDNRDVSNDSRDWKDSITKKHVYFVDEKNIKGKILLFN